MLLALALSACNKEYFEMDRLSTEMELEPKLVAPLVYGSMTIRDVTEKFDSAGYTGVFGDGLVYVAYRDTLVQALADTLVVIKDQVFHESFLDPEIGEDLVFVGGNIGDTAHFYRTNQLALQLEEDDRIDSVVLKEGMIQLKVTSTFMHDGWVVITSDQIRHPSGETLELTIPITSPDGNFSDSISIDSDHYHLETFEQGDSSVIQINYHLALINSGNPISPGDYCNITTGLSDIGFYGLYGHIGYRDLVSEGGELEIPIFQDVPELKALKLKDPRINIFTASSIGVSMELALDSVTATADEGTSLDLEFSSGHPFEVPGPDMAHMGETWTGEININRETSNFPDLLNLAPSHLSYGVRGRVLDEGPDRIHFILDTSRIMLEAEVMVPLDLKITGLALSDTMEFE